MLTIEPSELNTLINQEVELKIKAIFSTPGDYLITTSLGGESIVHVVSDSFPFGWHEVFTTEAYQPFPSFREGNLIVAPFQRNSYPFIALITPIGTRVLDLPRGMMIKQVAVTEDKIVVLFSGPKVTVQFYNLSDLSFISNLIFGDTNSRPLTLTKTNTGIQVSWYQHIVQERAATYPLELRFAHIREEIVETQQIVYNHSQIPSTYGTAVFFNNQVWHFTTTDGNSTMHLVKLQDGYPISADSEFLSKFDPKEIQRMGEFPKIDSMVHGNEILLAYPNDEYYFFSRSPFVVKGVYLVVIGVQADGSKALRQKSASHMYSGGYFAFGSGWHITAPIYEEDGKWYWNKITASDGDVLIQGEDIGYQTRFYGKGCLSAVVNNQLHVYSVKQG